MKIGSIDSKPVTPAAPAGGKAATTGASAPRAEPAAEASAKVALSPAAAQLAKGADDATFDASKVERIAAAIRDGTYKINANAIADKLIGNAEELLGRKVGH